MRKQEAVLGIPVDKFGNALATAFVRNVGSCLSEEIVGNALMARQGMLSALLDPRRDIDKECHYPTTLDISPEDYKHLFNRDSIANRVISCLAKETWQVQPTVFESEDPNIQTPFERGWDSLQPSTGGASWYKPEAGGTIWEYLKRIDILSGIGRFGVLLLGFDDGKNLQDPVDGAMVLNANPEGYNQYTGAGGSNREEFRVGKRRVIRNPTDGDISDLVQEFRDKYSIASGPKVRSTFDDQGNKYSWMSDSTHADIEPAISRKYGVRTDQNKYFTKNSNPEGHNQYTEGTAITQNRRQSIPDCYLTVNEEKNLRELPNLNEEEKRVLNQLAEDRKRIKRQIKLKMTANSGVSRIEEVPGTDKQYSQGLGIGLPDDPNLSGTDQQYFGVQFGPSEQPVKSPSKKELHLLFLRPFDESLVQIVRYEWNINNPRFGMPVMYRITLNDPREQHSGIGMPMATVFVHWSRVIHVNDVDANAGSSEIFSPPRCRPVLNRLLDLQKIYGASGEGYWQAAFTGLSLETHPQLGGDVTIDGADVRNQLENYTNSLQRYLALMGMSAHTLAPQVSDPSSQIEKQLEAICIQLAIPMRVFRGAERGELASSQDDADFNDVIRARQVGYVTPRIIVPLVDRLIAVGVLPEPKYQEPAKETIDDKDLTSRVTPDPNDQPQQLSPQFQGGNDQQEEDHSPSSLARNTRKLIPILNAAGKKVGIKTPTGYSVVWPDLDSLTDKDRAQIAQLKTQALAAFVSGNVEAVMPLAQFYTKVLGMTDEEAKPLVKAAIDQQVQFEQDQADQQAKFADQYNNPQDQFGAGGEEQFQDPDAVDEEDQGSQTDEDA